MIISAAGFGYRIHWEDDEAPPGHRLSFKRSIQIVSKGLFVRLLCPKWFFELGPTKRIREVRDAFAEFRVRLLSVSQQPIDPNTQSYLVEMINERRRTADKDEKRDLLSNLVDANEEFSHDGEQRLGEGELLGTKSALHQVVHLCENLPFRKHFHVLHRWTRGMEILDYLTAFGLSSVTDVRTYPFFRVEHARSSSRRARKIIPAYLGCSPGRPRTGAHETRRRSGYQS
jgi:hypothetical protein